MKLIGEIYKEKVLSLPRKQRKKFEIPLHSGTTKIENDFFGTKLYYRKLGRKSEEFIECRSEEEARYIKIFMDLEEREIFIPKDLKLIEEIVPELEYLKRRTDEIMNGYLRTIMRKAYREKLKFMVYREVMGEDV